jgi:serine protease Do
MNSLIVSQSQGSEGLGFAIPSNLVKEIAETLRRQGKVTRGDLGLAVQDLDDAIRRVFKLPPELTGVVVTEAIPLGPAASAGMTLGDVIVSFQGTAIASAADFNRATARARPGSDVALELLRDGARFTVALTVVDQLSLLAKQSTRPGYAFLGIRVRTVSTELAKTIGLPDPVGVVVVEVVPGSPADNVGITPGDIVFQVGGVAVNDEEGFRRRIGEAIQAENVVVLLRDGQSGRTGYMEVPLR